MLVRPEEQYRSCFCACRRRPKIGKWTLGNSERHLATSEIPKSKQCCCIGGRQVSNFHGPLHKKDAKRDANDQDDHLLVVRRFVFVVRRVFLLYYPQLYYNALSGDRVLIMSSLTPTSHLLQLLVAVYCYDSISCRWSIENNIVCASR